MSSSGLIRADSDYDDDSNIALNIKPKTNTILNSKDLNEEEDTTKTEDNFEPEPKITLDEDNEKIVLIKNIDCEDFAGYTLNCSMEAAIMYNSSRKAPPMPFYIEDWCKAIRHLTNCAIDWNTDCREVTDSSFSEHHIKGHMHVVDNVCGDDWMRTRYEELPECIESTSDAWESCYSMFKLQVDEQKNRTLEWTHYETHFYLCCARAEFRRCTLESLFGASAKCTTEQAMALQKFTVIVSEGDVFQDCDTNMMYSNCPGGDPRPSTAYLNKLMKLENNYGRIQTVLCDNLLMFVLLWCFYEYLIPFDMMFCF